jgi:hypothetical protein
VYFEGSPPAEEPYGIMLGELPQFYKFPFPMEISLFYEMQGNKKRVVYLRGGSCTCVFS